MKKGMNVETVENYIKVWEGRGYSNGIPEEAPYRRLEELNKIPSYRHIALAILNNNIQSLGITLPKSEYYNILKKIEKASK